MAYDIANLKTTRNDDPPRLLIYGPPGMGKTSLAAEFPNPAIIDVEAGIPKGIDIKTFGDIESFDNVMEAIKALYAQDHDRRTLIIDSIDRLEPLVWQKTCKQHNWKSIEDPGYGKGYVEADATWTSLISGCNALRKHKRMTIIYIAHSSIERFDDPSAAPYSRYDIRLHKRANALMEESVDGVFFINQDLSVKSDDVGFNKQVRHAEGGGTRWIHATPRPNYKAKNRYGIIDRIKYDKGQGYAQLAQYLPGQGDPAQSNTMENA